MIVALHIADGSYSDNVDKTGTLSLESKKVDFILRFELVYLAYSSCREQ